MSMDLQALMPWIAAVLSISTLLTNIYTIFTSPSRKNAADINKMHGDLVNYDRRIQAIEGEMKHLPSKESVHQLQLALTDMKGQITTMAKSSDATERGMRRVEEFILNRKD